VTDRETSFLFIGVALGILIGRGALWFGGPFLVIALIAICAMFAGILYRRNK